MRYAPLPVPVFALALSLGIEAPCPAQAVEAGFENVPYAVDSDWLDNKGPMPLLVYRRTIRVDKASWLRLHFGEATRLDGDSQLRITSLEDGAVQFFQAWSLREYRNASAHFNGGSVRIELLAGGMTRRNRVQLVSVDAGDPGPPPGPMTICGPTDDRKPSSDPRQARQWPTGCTTWLISAFAGVTAGHCTRTRAQSMHFNVPASSRGGYINLPSPSDQYPYLVSSIRRLDAGRGADWCVFVTVRNSNTGLYPGEKQRSWYKIGTVPSPPRTMRVTGYGVTSPPSARSQTQQTHTGPLVSVLSTLVRYTIDTMGGSSGSPVIDERTGNPVAIHSHSGCNSSVSNPGFNTGTRLDRSDLALAIAQTLKSKQPGTFTTFGQGCPGSAGTPALRRVVPPEIGNTFKFRATGLPPAGIAIACFGASDKKWLGLTLPIPLPGGAGPSCKVLVSYDIMLPLPIFFGVLPVALPVPNDRTLVGAVFFNQVVAIDKIRNRTVLTSSNAARSVIGF